MMSHDDIVEMCKTEGLVIPAGVEGNDFVQAVATQYAGKQGFGNAVPHCFGVERNLAYAVPSQSKPGEMVQPCLNCIIVDLCEVVFESNAIPVGRPIDELYAPPPPEKKPSAKRKIKFLQPLSEELGFKPKKRQDKIVDWLAKKPHNKSGLLKRMNKLKSFQDDPKKNAQAIVATLKTLHKHEVLRKRDGKYYVKIETGVENE